MDFLARTFVLLGAIGWLTATEKTKKKKRETGDDGRELARTGEKQREIERRGKLDLQMTGVFWVGANSGWVFLHKSWRVGILGLLVGIFKILGLLVGICPNYPSIN